MTLDQVVGRFPSAKRAGAGYALQCPAHEDRVASVSVLHPCCMRADAWAWHQLLSENIRLETEASK